MVKRRLAFLIVALLSSLTASGRAVAGEVSVSAAASLTAAFEAIAVAFESANPGQEVATNFAGTPTLVQQILEGAPVDVFASADEANMRRVVEAGKVAGTPQVFATNRLAILIEKGNPRKIESLADLARPGLVVALCAAAVPAGRYAREAFAKAGVSVPQASEELDVRAVVSRVAMGEADAGVVYVTDVRAAGDRAEGIDIPDSTNVVATYPIAALREAPSRAGAEAFVDFVAGPEGRRILEGFGFLRP